jgi:hypothetical protein
LISQGKKQQIAAKGQHREPGIKNRRIANKINGNMR